MKGMLKTNRRQTVAQLQDRLAEAEEALRAIREGEVDAIVVSGEKGPQLYSLSGAESVYRLIVDTMQEAAFTVAPDGTILYCNAQFARFVRRSAESLVGRPLKECVAPTEHAAVDGLLAQGWQKPVRQRLVFQDVGGTPVPAHIASSVLKQPEGESICVVATDLREMESSIELIQELREQKEALRQSEQRVALNNAELKSAQTQLQTLNESLEARVGERTAKVRQLADRLRGLATELVQVEQRERHRLATFLHDNIQQLLVAAEVRLSLLPDGDPKRVAEGVSKVVQIIDETLAASRSLTLELSPPILHQSGLAASLRWLAKMMTEKHLFTVRVRIQRGAEPRGMELRAFLFESVRELLLNAVKHSQVSEASVTMRRTPTGQCEIVVEDKGKGFDPASISAGPDGGFGIFSIQQRLEYLGGMMRIDSAPGRGTKTTLAIATEGPGEPLETSAVTAASERRRTAHTDSGGRIRVLLVDDHQIVRQGFCSLLQKEPDIEVVGEAENGSHALELARRRNPDVIVMDVSMPVMNGIEATRLVSKELPWIKVVAMSMYSEEDVVDAMRAAGAVAYLTKVRASDDLATTIRSTRNG